jgi:hypothetical protein
MKLANVRLCVGFWTPVIANPIARSMGRRPKTYTATDVSKCSKPQGETAPGYRSFAAEKAHVRFARDQLRGA